MTLSQDRWCKGLATSAWILFVLFVTAKAQHPAGAVWHYAAIASGITGLFFVALQILFPIPRSGSVEAYLQDMKERAKKRMSRTRLAEPPPK